MKRTLTYLLLLFLLESLCSFSMWGITLFSSEQEAKNSLLSPPRYQWDVSCIDSLTSSPQDSLKEKTLREVLIQHNISSKTPTLPPQKLEGKELKALSLFSIADALRLFNGIQIKDYGGIGGLKTINFRSMGSTHMGVFYDGVEVGNVQHGMVNLGEFSLEPIERIEVYVGQKSQELQPARDFASSGSLYLYTRRPQYTAHRPTSLRATIRGGSFGLFNSSLLWEQHLTSNLSTSFNGEWLQATGNYPFRYRRTAPDGTLAYDTTAVRANGDIKALRAESNLFGQWRHGDMHIKGYFYRNEQGVPGAIVSNVWRRGERMWVQNSFIQGIGNYRIGNYKGLFTAKYADYRLRYVNHDWRTKAIDERYLQREWYLSYAQSYQILPSWSLSLAYDFMHHSLERYRKDVPNPRRSTHLLALSSQYNTSDWGIQASLLSTYIADQTGLPNPPRYHTLTPSVIASYQHPRLPHLRWGALYKRSFRMPSFNDLYYIDIGEIHLEPEDTEQFNLSLDGIARWKGWYQELNFRLEAYYNRVQNKIIAYPKGQQFRWTMINLGRVSIQGVDAQLSCLIKPLREVEWRSTLRYTYQSARDLTDPETRYYTHQIPYAPRHTASWTHRIHWYRWQVGYSILYTGARYNQRENFPQHYMRPWQTHDLSVSYTLPIWRRQNLQIQAECNNIWAEDYEVVNNYPMPLRSYKLSLIAHIL